MGSKTLKSQKPARRSVLPEIRTAHALAPHLIEHRVPKSKNAPPLRPELAALAVEHLGEAFAVLEARGSDRLDFHEASVVGVRDLIAAAFEAGRKSAALSAEIATLNAIPPGTIGGGRYVPAHEFVDASFNPDQRKALANLIALIDEGVVTRFGNLTIGPRARIVELVKAVRA